MKVLEINSVCAITSTGRIVSDICRAGMDRGYSMKIAYGEQKYNNADANLDVYRIGSIFDNYTHALYTRLADRQGLGSKSATRKLLKEIDIYKPDVIHLHNLHGYYINYEILFTYLKAHEEIKVIWTLHDCWSFTGHCVHFAECGCDKYKTGCHKCPNKKEYPQSMFLDNSRSNYERKKAAFTGHKNLTIVVPSRWLENKVKESFLKEYKTVVINNGVDLDGFVPMESDFRYSNNLNGKFVLLSVANIWTKNKGLDYIKKLMERYKKEGRDDVKAVVVGRVPDTSYTLPDNVVYIPFTNSKEELSKIYSAADVYISFSSEETFGMTVVEAISSGTWPIVMKETACEEIVAEAAGSICERNADAVYDEIERLRKEGFPGPEMVSAVAGKFNNKEFTDKILNLYQTP